MDTIRESTQVRGIISTPRTHVADWPRAPYRVFASGALQMLLDQRVELRYEQPGFLPFDSFFVFLWPCGSFQVAMFQQQSPKPVVCRMYCADFKLKISLIIEERN